MNYYEMKEKLIKCIEEWCKEEGFELDINSIISFMFFTGIANKEVAKEYVKVHGNFDSKE